MARHVASTSFSPVALSTSVRVGTVVATLAMLAVLASVIAGAQRVAAGAPLLSEDLSWLMFTTG